MARRLALAPPAAALRRLAIVASTVVATSSPAQTSVVVEHRTRLEADVTAEEARRSALDHALAEAVRSVVGVRLRAGELRSVVEGPHRTTDRFFAIVRTDVAGRVIDYEGLDEGWVQSDASSRTDDLYYHVNVRATVADGIGEPDPAFQISLALNDDVYVYRGAPGENDEIVVSVRTTRDAYLDIFTVVGDSIRMPHPNPIVRDHRIAAGETLVFPSPEWRRRGLRIRVDTPRDRAEIEDAMLVVATKGDVPFAESLGAVGRGEVRMVSAPLLDLQRWLVDIPLDERSLALSPYLVKEASPAQR